MAGTDVCPLAQIGLAQNDGSGFSQLLRHERIFRWTRSQQCQRTRSRLHLVSGINVVFDQDRNAMQRAASLFFLPLSIETLGDRVSLRIDFEYAVDRWTSAINFLNPSKVFLCDRA